MKDTCLKRQDFYLMLADVAHPNNYFGCVQLGEKNGFLGGDFFSFA